MVVRRLSPRCLRPRQSPRKVPSVASGIDEPGPTSPGIPREQRPPATPRTDDARSRTPPTPAGTSARAAGPRYGDEAYPPPSASAWMTGAS